MKILDKVKNFFYDEEEIEVIEGTVNKEKKQHNSIDASPLKEPEGIKVPNKEPNNNIEDIVSERELFQSDTTFKFPIIFEEDDFIEEKSQKRSMNVLEVENTKIKREKVTIESKQIFVPTPIISPIYGVLGQETKDNKKDNQLDDSFLNLYDNTDNVDIDSILSKAYGKTRTEKNSIIKETIKTEIDIEESIDLFKNITDDNANLGVKEEIGINNNQEFSKDNINTDTARLKSIDELLESTDEQDFYTLVDSMYENNEE